MLDLISGGPSTIFKFSGSSTDVGRFIVSLVVLSMGAFLSLRGSSHVPRTHFSPSPVHIKVRKSTSSKEVEKISLRDFVETRCPSLSSPFVPAWWLNRWVFAAPFNPSLTHGMKQWAFTNDILRTGWFFEGRQYCLPQVSGALQFKFYILTPEIRKHLRLMDGGTLLEIYSSNSPHVW